SSRRTKAKSGKMPALGQPADPGSLPPILDHVMGQPMKGLYCDGSTIRLRHDLPAPEAAPGETVLDVLTVGVCDTDLQLAQGYMGFRGVLGHEFVGKTDAGRRVTAEINNSCMNCPVCRSGLPQHCPNRTVLGILNRDGAMAERVRVPVVNLHEIPDAL